MISAGRNAGSNRWEVLASAECLLLEVYCHRDIQGCVEAVSHHKIRNIGADTCFKLEV